jgi:hypothetical protein
MANNQSNPFFVSDGIGSVGCVVVNPSTSYTVGANDNVIICGANSLAITLTATSNSPVYVTSVDGTTQRTSCTVVVGSQDWVIADSGASAYCIRYGPASQNLWAIIGAKTAS